MSEVIVRRAVLADAAAIVEFNAAMAFETENKQLDKTVLEAGVHGLFERPEQGFYLVAEVGGKVQASLMITYEWSDWRNGIFWWIQSVYVAKEARRTGLYSALYGEVKRLATEPKGEKNEVCGIRLYVEQENRVAQKTYATLGMSKSGYQIYEELLC